MKQITDITEKESGGYVRDITNQATLRIKGHEVRIEQAQQGSDFVFGNSLGCIVAIPLHRIDTMRSPEPPPIRDMGLIDFLELQRVPVQLEIESGGRSINCWLLNVAKNWLRISSHIGVEWAPVTALLVAKINPVDKSRLLNSL